MAERFQMFLGAQLTARLSLLRAMTAQFEFGRLIMKSRAGHQLDLIREHHKTEWKWTRLPFALDVASSVKPLSHLSFPPEETTE